MSDDKVSQDPPEYIAPNYSTQYNVPQYNPGAQYVVPSAPVGNPTPPYAAPMQGQPPMPVVAAPPGDGNWKNGLCGCTKSLPWCIIGCCLPGVLLARIGDHMKNWEQVRPLLIILAFMTLLGGFSGGFSSSANSQDMRQVALALNIVACMFGMVSLVLLVIFIFKMCKLRGEVRKRYNIGGSELNDLLTTCCCTVCCCCSLHECQMFYEVAEYEKMQLD